MSDPTAYKKVIGGGLKFKGGGSLAKPMKKKTGVASGAEKALGLERPKAFKREHADGADSTLPPGSASAASAAAASSSAAAASSSGVIYPPVVLAPSASGVASKSLWGLNKNELHEIDANLSALREADRSIDKMEASSKRELVEREKRAVEMQVSNFMKSDSAPGLKFSIPNVANINKEYLFRKEAQVSDATARLNARASKKSDKFCK